MIQKPQSGSPFVDKFGVIAKGWAQWVENISRLASKVITTDSVHNDVGGRDAVDCHPINAITDLSATINTLQSTDQANETAIATAKATADTALTTANQANNKAIDALAIGNANTSQISDLGDSLHVVENDLNTLETLVDLKLDKSNITKQGSGFDTPASVQVSYDATTRKITLAGTGQGYWQHNAISGLTYGFVSDARPDTAGIWFLKYDGSAYSWSNTQWGFDEVQIAFGIKSATAEIWLRECHGLMDWTSHQDEHQARGTYKTAGGDFSAYTTGSNTASNRRPLISSTTLWDEDLPSVLPSLATNSYSWFWLTGAGVANITTANAEILRVTGSQPNYNQFTTSWGQTAFTNNQYGKIFIVAVPTTQDATNEAKRYLFIQPQTASTSLTTIQAVTSDSVNWGDFTGILPEFNFIGEIIVRYQGGNWVLTSVAKINGSRVSQSISGSGFLSSVSVDGTTITGDGTPSSPLAVGTIAQSAVTNLTTDLAGKQAIPTGEGEQFQKNIYVKSVSTANVASLSAPQTIDGIALVANDLVFLKNQTSTPANGVYRVNAGAWTKATSYDADTEIRTTIVVTTSDGTTNKRGYSWICTNTSAITVGTTNLTFAQIPFGLGTGATNAATGNHSHTSIATTASSSIGQQLRLRYTSRTASATTATSDLWVVMSGTTAGQTETMYDGTAVSNNSGVWLRYTNRSTQPWTISPATSNTINGVASSFVLPSGYSVDLFNTADNAWVFTYYGKTSALGIADIDSLQTTLDDKVSKSTATAQTITSDISIVGLLTAKGVSRLTNVPGYPAIAMFNHKDATGFGFFADASGNNGIAGATLDLNSSGNTRILKSSVSQMEFNGSSIVANVPVALATYTELLSDLAGRVRIRPVGGVSYLELFSSSNDVRLMAYDRAGASYQDASIRAKSISLNTNGTSRVDVTDSSTKVNNPLVLTQKTPASASASGIAGEICADANYIYHCVATNTWKRVAIATW